MGKSSSKPSTKEFEKVAKKPPLVCCLCKLRSTSDSSLSSSFSFNDKYIPTFDRLLSHDKHRLSALNAHGKTHPSSHLSLAIDKYTEKSISKHLSAKDQRPPAYVPSVDHLEKSPHPTASIDQWVDSLAALDAFAANRTSDDQTTTTLTRQSHDYHLVSETSILI